jgi:hypothetical protein
MFRVGFVMVLFLVLSRPRPRRWLGWLGSAGVDLDRQEDGGRQGCPGRAAELR